METFVRLLLQSLTVGAICLALFLGFLDVASGAALTLPSGVIVTGLALWWRGDVVYRSVAASTLSLVATGVLMPQGFVNFGLMETGGLGLLLVVATREIAGRAAVPVTGLLALAVLAVPQRLDTGTLGFTLALAACVGAAVGLGSLLRMLDERRQRTLDGVRTDERLAIARDLHDSVAHHVTGIVVAAQAGQVAAARNPAAAVEALGAIERAGAETMASMRRMVALLREGDAARVPLGDLGGLRRMVERFDDPGVTVDLHIDEAVEHGSVPDEVLAAVQRVVQEGLTNVRRHAIGTGSVEVTIRRGDGQVDVMVRNDGEARPRRGDGGYGLVGIAERVDALGGRSSARPGPRGGWELTAEIPIQVMPQPWAVR